MRNVLWNRVDDEGRIAGSEPVRRLFFVLGTELTQYHSGVGNWSGRQVRYRHRDDRDFPDDPSALILNISQPTPESPRQIPTP